MPRLQTLNSWKEIADYLNRSVRTVQRWEARFGLPVRHRPGKRTSVFAIEAELNSWLQTRSTFRLTEHDLPAAYEMIFRIAPVAMGVVNDRREWVDANGFMTEILGKARHELNGSRLDDVILENDRGNLSTAWEMMLSRGGVSNILLLKPSDGPHPKWVEFRGVASVAPGLHLIALTPTPAIAGRLSKVVGFDDVSK